MIVVLKDADFSANNIGTIEIPYELSQSTKDLLTHLTKYDEEDREAIRLDMFLKALNSASWKSKIKFLCLPAFASTISECFYNIIDGENYAPEVVDIYEVRNYGYGINPNVDLTDKNTNDRYTLGLIPEKVGVSGADFDLSAGVYDATGISTSAIFGFLSTPFVLMDLGKVRIGINDATIETTSDANNLGSKGLRSMSYKGNDLLIDYCGLAGTGTTRGSSFTPTTHKFPSSTGRVQFCGYSINPNMNTGTVSLMFVGNYLTQSELEDLREKVNNLMSFMN